MFMHCKLQYWITKVRFNYSSYLSLQQMKCFHEYYISNDGVRINNRGECGDFRLDPRRTLAQNGRSLYFSCVFSFYFFSV